MPLKGTPGQRKAQVFKEFKAGNLHSGKGGPVVKSPKQAVAIALSQGKRKPGAKTTGLVIGLLLASGAAWAQTPPAGQASLNQAIAGRAVVKSDATVIPATRGLYVGDAAACTVVVTMREDAIRPTPTVTTFANVQPGSFLPVSVAKVMAATTCATVVALY